MQCGSRRANCRAEAARGFLEWITGETSPTLYVSFWKKKRENLRGLGGPRTALIFAIDMSNPIYALVLAGGSGERIWPLSRRGRHKQLLRLVSKRALLEASLPRLDGLDRTGRMVVLTNAEQEA